MNLATTGNRVNPVTPLPHAVCSRLASSAAVAHRAKTPELAQPAIASLPLSELIQVADHPVTDLQFAHLKKNFGGSPDFKVVANTHKIVFDCLYEQADDWLAILSNAITRGKRLRVEVGDAAVPYLVHVDGSPVYHDSTKRYASRLFPGGASNRVLATVAVILGELGVKTEKVRDTLVRIRNFYPIEKGAQPATIARAATAALKQLGFES